MMRRLMVCLAGFVLLLGTACGGADDAGRPADAPATTALPASLSDFRSYVERAAARTEEAGTARLVSSIQTPGAAAIEVDGVFDFAGGTQSFAMVSSLLGDMEGRVIDEVMYISVPDLPGGVTWLRIGPESYDMAAQEFGLDPDTLFSSWTLRAGVEAITDAAVGFADLGITDLRDGPAHCWAVELDSLPEALGLVLTPTEATEFAALDMEVTAEICVDDVGRLARNSLEMTVLDEETGGTMTMDAEYYALGTPVVIEPPPRNDYVEYADLEGESLPSSDVAADTDAASATAQPTPHDGLWMGTTSQGEEMGFRIEAGEATWALLERSASVCPGSYVGSMQAYDPALGYASDGEIHLTLGPDGDQIDGEFESVTTAHGTATVDCGSSIDLTWEAELLGDSDTDIPQSDWFGATPPAGVLPGYDIPDRLVDNDAGSANFNEMSVYFDSNDDWYLVGTWVESFIPVPAGWTIIETGSGMTGILFSEQRDLVLDEWGDLQAGEPEIGIFLQTIWDDPTVSSVADALADFEPGAGDDPQTSVLASELVDDAHGYAVIDALSPDGKEMRTLFVFADNPDAGWLDVLIAEVALDSWDDYYPIIRGMVHGWYNVHDDRLGLDLPETLS